MKLRNLINSKLFWLLPVTLIIVLGGVIYRSMPKTLPPSMTNVSPRPISSGEVITFSGEIVCLPHKNTSGPQTAECAYGLKTPEGMYYALHDSDPRYKHISDISMGKKGEVQGLFTPKTDKIYPIEGIIEVQSVSISQ